MGVIEESRAFEVHVFRVDEGLGNACLLRLPDGEFGIVDWGTTAPRAFGALFDLVATSRIRFVAATHAHADHTLGLPELLRLCDERDIPVGRFVFPASTLHKEDAYLTRARAVAFNLKIPQHSVSVDDFEGPHGLREPPALAWGDGWDVYVLSPPATGVGKYEIKGFTDDVVPGNETSFVLLFRFVAARYGRVVLTGDATRGTLNFARKVTEQFPELRMDNGCLVIPHHGSRNGVPDWLYEHSAGAVVLSAPTDDIHHPSHDTLREIARRLSGRGEALFCTSYALACRQQFGKAAGARARHLVAEGPCFGDISVRVTIRGGWTLTRSSEPGQLRRRFGHCGQASPPAAGGAS